MAAPERFGCRGMGLALQHPNRPAPAGRHRTQECHAMAKSALEMLKADHDKVRALLTKLSETTPSAAKTRPKLLEEIENEVLVHTKLEEEIFYPAFKKAGGKEHDRMFYEAMEEHRAVEKLVLPDLKKTPADSEKFSGRVKVLKELIEHHAEEEEDELFKEAEQSMSKEQLDQLGREMEERRKALKKH
jgi:hemerythrin superfamily protein